VIKSTSIDPIGRQVFLIRNMPEKKRRKPLHGARENNKGSP
jgi:hypothetical protein